MPIAKVSRSVSAWIALSLCLVVIAASTAPALASATLPPSSPAALSGAALDAGETRQISLGAGRYTVVVPAVGPAATIDQAPTFDTYVCNYDGCDSECSAEFFEVGESGSSIGRAEYWAFLAFNLGSIPSTATVNSATLYLYQYGANGANPAVMYMGRPNRTWSCPLEWHDVQVYFENVSMTEIDASDGWKTWDVKSLVRDYWIGKQFGEEPNYGIRLSPPTTGFREPFERYFRSQEYRATYGSPYSPHLVVEYTLATPYGRLRYLPLLVRGHLGG